MEKVRKELKQMEKDGVITSVNEPTDWCAPMVIVQKPNGNVRICADFTELNRFVKRETWQLPSVEESLAKLKNAKVFTKLDCTSSFWQIKLKETSQLLTTFVTPYGRFAYKRLPFGISSAPEIFQKAISKLIGDEENVLVHADDILVLGRNKEEHDKILNTILNKLKEAGITLNTNKCKFEVNEIKYLGYIITNSGIKADPECVRAIQEYPEPTNKTEVRRFLGLFTYLTKFVKNASENTKDLRDLLKNDNIFNWSKVHHKCFNNLKQLITETPVLATYNTDYETRVSTDASQFGIGGILEQKQPSGTWRVVYYCSKSLTDTQRRYAQIEKEMYAIVWTCERLDQFLIGKIFSIQTDHKPLVPILQSKPINDLTIRLQRFRMKMVKFTYTVSHVPGKELFVPDALSRAPLGTQSEQDIAKEDIFIATVQEVIDTFSGNERKIIKDQNSDEVLSNLKDYIQNGCTNEKKLKQQIGEYYKYKDGINIMEEILTYKDRIIIPSNLRTQYLAKIHIGHMGINKCKSRAKTIWWPRIGKTIKELVNNCKVCIKHRTPQTEPLLQVNIPMKPWHTVGVDLFDLNGKNYLLIQDYYSHFPEVIKLNRIRSQDIIDHMKEVFSRFGFPTCVRSDNGKQFDAYEFKKFSEESGFKWISSSPMYPQSNGFIEAGVKTIKNLLKKSSDPYLALLAYRNTPLFHGLSPAQLLMSKNLKETLPFLNTFLDPQVPDHERTKNEIRKRKIKEKENYDVRHRCRPSRELKDGERVWITTGEQEGTIISKSKLPRSYWVAADSGRNIRRNRKHLQPIPEQEPPERCTTTIEQNQSPKKRRSERSRKRPDRYTNQ